MICRAVKVLHVCISDAPALVDIRAANPGAVEEAGRHLSAMQMNTA